MSSSEFKDEREVAKAKAWQSAKATMRTYASGCLILAILALCFLFYVAGAVSVAIRPCVTSSHATP